MPEAELVEAFGRTIDQRFEPEPLDEALQFPLGHRLLEKVHEVRLDPAFGEEPERLSGIRTFFHAEDLYFHIESSAGSSVHD